MINNNLQLKPGDTFFTKNNKIITIVRKITEEDAFLDDLHLLSDLMYDYRSFRSNEKKISENYFKYSFNGECPGYERTHNFKCMATKLHKLFLLQKTNPSAKVNKT